MNIGRRGLGEEKWKSIEDILGRIEDRSEEEDCKEKNRTEEE
jgi:hypothetical protein